jgi:hypothetical protein
MSNDNESFRLGLEAADHAFHGESGSQTKWSEVVEVYSSLGA